MTIQLAHVTIEIVGRQFLAIWTPEDDVVRAAGFREPVAPGGAGSGGPGSDTLWQRLAASDPALAARGIADAPSPTAPVAVALRAYASGDISAVDALAVSQRETPFRAEVWRALRGVPTGVAVTYGELAERAGRPTAVRAAASGCATNLVALIVPCHRIVRGDGSLGGYLFGVDTKQRLLAHEGFRCAQTKHRPAVPSL